MGRSSRKSDRSGRPERSERPNRVRRSRSDESAAPRRKRSRSAPSTAAPPTRPRRSRGDSGGRRTRRSQQSGGLPLLPIGLALAGLLVVGLVGGYLLTADSTTPEVAGTVAGDDALASNDAAASDGGAASESTVAGAGTTADDRTADAGARPVAQAGLVPNLGGAAPPAQRSPSRSQSQPREESRPRQTAVAAVSEPVSAPLANASLPATPTPAAAPAPPATRVAKADETPRRGKPAKPFDGPEFVRVKAGEFTIGTDRGQRNQMNRDHPFSIPIKMNTPFDESPSHAVRLTKDYEMAAREVTVGEFRKFVEATGYVTDAEKPSNVTLGFYADKNDTSKRELHFDRFNYGDEFNWKNPGFPQEDDHPVVCVSFEDARAYCEWLSKTRGGSYRLPTEAEWEYACRAGTTTWYSTGDDPDELYDYANVADAALEQKHPGLAEHQRVARLEPGEGDGFAYTAPVGSLHGNPWGLHDMHGNVWEWTSDKFDAQHYSDRIKEAAGKSRGERVRNEDVVIVDPTGPEDTTAHEYGDWRVIRGGGWNVGPISNRCAIRGYGNATDGFCYTGFRIVRDLK